MNVIKRLSTRVTKSPEKIVQVFLNQNTPSPRVTRILVPEKHRVMRKPC